MTSDNRDNRARAISDLRQAGKQARQEKPSNSISWVARSPAVDEINPGAGL
jgi:hypothetical protein